MAQTKKSDKNLALIAVILGAASFTNTIFTGIPAIVFGIMALKRKAGDRTQAKLGIVFGVIGSLLIIPIIFLAMRYLSGPWHEQFSVPQTDRRIIVALADKLLDHRKKFGEFPRCSESDSKETCTAWQSFSAQNNLTVMYPLAFESGPTQVEDRPAGTLVLAYRATCLLNTPTMPDYVEDDYEVDEKKFAALVYFYEEGRACFNVGDV